MKKKWSIFLLTPILLTLIALLAIYLLKSPKRIKNESIGTEYTFKDIQFDMVSDDFYLLEETYEVLLERGKNNLMPFKNSNGNSMLVIRNDNTEFFYEQMDTLSNPINLFLVERDMLNTIDSESGYQAQEYKIFLFEGNNKVAILHYSLSQDFITSWSLDLLLEEEFYTISLVGEDLEVDAYEIIRTVNLK